MEKINFWKYCILGIVLYEIIRISKSPSNVKMILLTIGLTVMIGLLIENVYLRVLSKGKINAVIRVLLALILSNISFVGFCIITDKIRWMNRVAFIALFIGTIVIDIINAKFYKKSYIEHNDKLKEYKERKKKEIKHK